MTSSKDFPSLFGTTNAHQRYKKTVLPLQRPRFPGNRSCHHTSKSQLRLHVCRLGGGLPSMASMRSDHSMDLALSLAMRTGSLIVAEPVSTLFRATTSASLTETPLWM